MNSCSSVAFCCARLRQWPSVRWFVAGSTSAGGLAMANMALDPHTESGWSLVVVFSTVCFVAFDTDLGSHRLLIRLAQDACNVLRRNLAHKIIRTPLH